MRRLSILLALVVCLLWRGYARALVVDFENLAEGTIVNDPDLPCDLTISVDSEGDVDQVIIFDSTCPPSNAGLDCSGGDPDLLTPGGALGGIGNDTAQGKILIIAENVIDVLPGLGLVDDPDDEALGGFLAFTLPVPAKLRSIRLLDIDNTEGDTTLVLQLAAGGTQTITAIPLGNNSAQTLTVPDPVPDVTGFVVNCAGSCGIDDIVIGDEFSTECPSVPTSTTSITNPTSTTTTTTTTTPQPFCGDGEVDPGEECDDGETNSNEPDATCRPNCTPKRCGDGIVDTGEICDSGPANGDGLNAPCRTDCTLPFCGDGVLDTVRGEQCDPPARPDAENCANLLDDDGDGLIDCADAADCPAMVQRCGFDCQLAMCSPIRRDPALIRFNAHRSGSDMFWVHGNFRAAHEVDFTKDRFAIMLTNENGIVYQATLVPGEFKRMINGKGRYVFRDRDARAGRGRGDADGIYRVSLRERLEQGSVYVYFRLRAYGDFSSATVPTMTTQIAAGDYVGTLTADWRKTGYGWVLKQRYFGEVE